MGEGVEDLPQGHPHMSLFLASLSQLPARGRKCINRDGGKKVEDNVT